MFSLIILSCSVAIQSCYSISPPSKPFDTYTECEDLGEGITSQIQSQNEGTLVRFECVNWDLKKGKT